jgi:hypothetical protein
LTDDKTYIFGHNYSMLNPIHVIILGNSPLMANLANQLKDTAGLSIHRVMPTTGSLYHPDIILIESGASQAGQAVRLLQRFPDAQLLALDVDQGRVLRLSSAVYPLADTSDLEHLLFAMAARETSQDLAGEKE